MCCHQWFQRYNFWRSPCFGFLGSDLNIFLLVSWVSFFWCQLKGNRPKPVDLSDVELNQWETSDNCGISSQKKSWAKWCFQPSAGWCCLACCLGANALRHLAPSLLWLLLHSGTKSFFPQAAHRARCNFKYFVTHNAYFCFFLFLFLLFCKYLTMLLFKAKAVTKSWLSSPKNEPWHVKNSPVLSFVK